MLEEIKSKLNNYNQGHLLNFYDELSDVEKQHLIDQINSIDFELIINLYKNVGQSKEDNKIEAMKSFDIKEEYKTVGLESMKKGEYALVTMAGGQGTRLGFDGPKGTYTLGYEINKSLFEIQCDKLKNIYQMSGIYTPWYIMTSNANNKATIDFFEFNNYFDYPREKIEFFIQEELPMVGVDGKILMDSKFNIKMGANGSGGVFLGLSKNGLIDKLKEQNIKWVFIGGIDNILLPTDNPDLLGFAIKEGYKAVSKITTKAYPEEKIGVFVKKNGKPSVIEYIEMTPEMNNLRDENGNLVYSDGHVLHNLFNISVLDDIAKKQLDYYSAFKKANYIDESGNMITPEKENAYKFECFIFDGFSYVDDVGLLRGKREEMFAPIKNATGIDSPETASKLYLDYHRK